MIRADDGDLRVPIVDGMLATAKEAVDFILAGNATFTIRSKESGERFTFRVKKPKKKVDSPYGAGDQPSNPTIYFIELLTGSSNETDYGYLGFIRNGQYIHGGIKARITVRAKSHLAFVWVWDRLANDRIPSNIEIWHEGRCGRCGRKLTVPSSIASGLGPECAGKMEG
jgi:Family of unknown function (DUF6011)